MSSIPIREMWSLVGYSEADMDRFEETLAEERGEPARKYRSRETPIEARKRLASHGIIVPLGETMYACPKCGRRHAMWSLAGQRHQPAFVTERR